MRKPLPIAKPQAVPATVPSQDGQKIVYEPDPLSGDASVPVSAPDKHRGHGPKIMYINGMATDGTEYARTAKILANLVSHPIIGIYNRTGRTGIPLIPNVVQDLAQSFGDYAMPIARVPALVTSTIPQLSTASMRHTFLRMWLSAFNPSNRAALVIYDEIYATLQKHRRMYIVCHSQGALITCNVLWALKWVKYPQPLGNIYVYALGSPAGPWPTVSGLRIKKYSNKNDPITYLSWPSAPGARLGWGCSRASAQYALDPIRSKLAAHSVNPTPNGLCEGYVGREDFIQDIHRDLRLF